MPGDPAARAALAAAADLGPFFATSPDAGPDWVTWDRLTADPAVLGGRLAEVRTVLAGGPGSPAVDPVVGASIAHLGLVARLVAPVLGAALLTGTLPVSATSSVHLRLSGTNPHPLAVTLPRAVPAGGSEQLAGAFDEHWLAPAIAPLGDAVRTATGVPPQVLAGNVVSATAGALRMAAQARPGLAAAADEVLRALLRSGPLAGTGSHRSDGSFVRRSCCLFYRIPGAGTCGDCVLRQAPGGTPDDPA
ncbi:(2Fe-2S)-binding protein [Blastococcus sp. TML/M2B]|uniref:(2Fe-2S)-binding protein n=1 Tax=unclassified Blastococcus TaxID=2619396 RepID=UPI00190C6EEA|nr:MULTISPECIES: (2Fe-2S)-binding protein [unclassified Blastococcus]MBN1093214.1 (2Fe-2S)-binding protein [Blastococcus sp. TML/M2B]MBN1096675.1 (2Fe-2S)-binding protein [Blastococcus sp. TML/C7B]